MMSDLLGRVAGAPITWGVCEVAGWGHQLAPERVLREAAGVGLQALELGPPGFLPGDSHSVRLLLEMHGLRLAAGFLAVVLHRPEEQRVSLESVARTAEVLADAGAEVMVLAAETGQGGYEASADLEEDEWRTLVEGLDRAREIGESRGIVVALHPHYGTLIETAEQVDRLLRTSDIPLCVDTGHLLVGGADPLQVIRRAGERVVHVHLKDVDASLAARVRSRELGYRAAVASGMYRPLGEGDVDVEGVMRHLESIGYRGWYVLEQDAVLQAEPADNAGPAAEALRSLEHLAAVTA
jgi:inosose dehydratase